jgi:hypothetical protein
MIDSDIACKDKLPEQTFRRVELVRLSLILTFILEVCPLEIDLLFPLLLAGDYCRAMIAKLICVTSILLPLVIFSWLNGPRALWYFKGRVAIIVIIVAVQLGSFISYVINHSR